MIKNSNYKLLFMKDLNGCSKSDLCFHLGRTKTSPGDGSLLRKINCCSPYLYCSQQ